MSPHIQYKAHSQNPDLATCGKKDKELMGSQEDKGSRDFLHDRVSFSHSSRSSTIRKLTIKQV
jgi:hypothetical protein